MTLHRLPAFIAATTMLAAPALADETRAQWRLFVADQATGLVTAVNLDSPRNRWRFTLAGPAKLYPTATGKAVVAVQSDDDTVAFLRSGIGLEMHGDHADIATEAPTLVDARLDGPRPFHVVTHDGTSAINFDRGGYAAFLTEAAILDGSLDMTEFRQATAHHGFSVPMGDVVVSSVASMEPQEGDHAAPRVGIQAFGVDGVAVGAMETCTDLHGEAVSGGVLVAGCAEGVVAVRPGSGGPDFHMMPYPDDLPAGKTGTLLGAVATRAFLGDYGADAVVVIDTDSEPHFRRVPLPFRRVDFVLDPARPDAAFVLTEDGTLHRLDMETAEVAASAAVTQAYSMDGDWRDPRPRLAVADGRILLTDPLAGEVKIVDADTLEVVDAIPVPGLPYNIVAVGGIGLMH